MPTQNVNIASNQNVLIKSNPKDATENDTTLPSDVTWSLDTNLYGDLVLQNPPFNDRAKFTGNGSGRLGVSNIVMACQGKTAGYQVTVIAGPFDHFAPSNDPPQNN